MYFKKILLILIALVSLFLLYYITHIPKNEFTPTYTGAHSLSYFLKWKPPSISTVLGKTETFIVDNLSSTSLASTTTESEDEVINIWCIFTKVRAPLKGKFRVFVESLVRHSTSAIVLNVLSDEKSKGIARDIIEYVGREVNKTIGFMFYDIGVAAQQIDDIVKVMMPYFSSQPGTYYSDALFYMSMGLHRIAPKTQQKAIMLDCDIKFVSDVKFLFEQFNLFTNSTLFGLAPELSPVYRHILYNYRLKHNTSFGDPLKPVKPPHYTGYPGLNSGVMLFNLERIRNSEFYGSLISEPMVQNLVKKYLFKGHLGDQDYFTILGYERPELVHMLPCQFNRQLCVWWRDHGYSDIFEQYFQCGGNVKIYHGNCNTPVPNTQYFYNIN